MFCSNCAFSSSSGTNSKNIPKSYKCKLCTSSKVPTLNELILASNASLVNGYSNESDILKETFSHVLAAKYKLACNTCLVAVLEFAAANFCKPTKELGSGVLPSLA